MGKVVSVICGEENLIKDKKGEGKQKEMRRDEINDDRTDTKKLNIPFSKCGLMGDCE